MWILKWRSMMRPFLVNHSLFCSKSPRLTWLHPGRLTWNIIMGVWKMIFLSKWVIYRFQPLIFQESGSSKSTSSRIWHPPKTTSAGRMGAKSRIGPSGLSHANFCLNRASRSRSWPYTMTGVSLMVHFAGEYYYPTCGILNSKQLYQTCWHSSL